MSEIINLSRRDFLKTSGLFGGGLLLGFSLPIREALSQEAALPSGPVVPNAFIHINKDDMVTIIVNKVEMGQGVYTSLPMLVAEELGCDWNKIRVEPAPVAPVYINPILGSQGTGASTSILTEWERFRRVGATVRQMLIAAAADLWKVDKTSCRAENSRIIHSSGKQLTYGQLAERAAKMEMPKEVKLKNPSRFKFIGKPIKRLDTVEKTDGTAIFGIDVKVPGMLTAAIIRPPVFGAKVNSIIADKAKAVPGVREVVSTDSGVAVVADTFWSALQGRDALQIVWDEGPLATFDSQRQRNQYAELSKKPGVVVVRRGDIGAAMAQAAKKIEAEYEVPYLAHVPMEPLNCLVDLRPDSCEIWTGTQNPEVHRLLAAQVAGLKPEQVRIHIPFLGGGFGRRGNPQADFVVDAVQVAKAMKIKKPVKVIWTREETIKGGWYRPMWHSRFSGGLDEKGNLIAWQHTIVGQSILLYVKPTISQMLYESLTKGGIDATSVHGAADMPYRIPNFLLDLHSPGGIPVQMWRSVNRSHTAFVVESFIDEIAHTAGKDPYQFRRTLLSGHPRHIGVLDLAAQKAGWGKPTTRGRFRGIALHELSDSMIALVAEVSVSPTGDVRVHKVVCAVDCGRVVNPNILAAMMESGVVWGLSMALHSEITLKNGRVEQSNFDDYRVLRMEEMPKVETYIVPSEGHPGGAGEVSVPPIAPAVTNAIFAATGKRIRHLPIRSAELKKT